MKKSKFTEFTYGCVSEEKANLNWEGLKTTLWDFYRKFRIIPDF